MSTRYYPGEVEVWKDIPTMVGYYQVSTFGNMRSVDRKVNAKGKKSLVLRKGRTIRYTISKDGYCFYGFSIKNHITNKRIHRLSLETFEGACPPKMEGCHKDGNSLNNHISNLKWDTKSNNELDKRNHGTSYCGERCHYSKLKASEVILIRKLVDHGIKQVLVGKMFKISQPVVSKIKLRENWRHLNG